MRIFVLGSYPEYLMLFRTTLMKTMVKQSHEVIACVPDASEDEQKKLETMGIGYQSIMLERTGLNPAQDMRTFQMLRTIFSKLKPDILLSYTIKPVIYGSFAAKLSKIPQIYSIITGLGYAFTANDIKSRWLNRMIKTLYRFSLRYNRKVFFQNPDDAKLFTELCLVNSEQSVIINGSGIDIHDFQPAPFPESLSFLLIARLIKEKGIREYVEAARQLKPRYPHVAFRLVGWIDAGNPASISESELNDWIAEGTIDYLGRLTDVRSAIAASSVYVLPSYREGTPRSVLEAMAMGRPIITTDAPGCRETVQPQKNGLLIPIKNASALAEAMELFIQKPDIIESMGASSRQHAVEKYDVHRVNTAILDAMDLGR